MKWAKSVLAVVSFFTLAAASGYVIEPSTNKIMPPEQPILPGTELDIGVRELFYRQPVGANYVATLDKDVAFTIADQPFSIPGGTGLSVARVSGDAAQNVDDKRLVYCTPPKNNWNAGKGLAALVTLGLANSAHRFDPSTQLCLIDNDGDKQVEKAILSGARRKQDLLPIDISLTPVTVLQNAPLPGESYAGLYFASAGGLWGDLNFELRIVENGVPLSFDNGRYTVPIGQLPKSFGIFGARFTVLSYDKALKKAKIRWERGFSEGAYSVTTTTTTTYVPIYIPR